MNEWLKSEITELWDRGCEKHVTEYNWEVYELKDRLDFLLEVLESFQIDIQKTVESDGKLYNDIKQKRDVTLEYHRVETYSNDRRLDEEQDG